MLVHRDFGTPAEGLNMPYFTLYNRYRGLFRVIVYNSEQLADSLYLGHLSLQNPKAYPANGTPAFTFANNRGACSISNYDPDQVLSSVTTMDMLSDWGVFDFHLLGYDPGLAGKDPLMTFRIEAVKKSQVRMSGKGVMEFWQVSPTSMVPGLDDQTGFKDAALSIYNCATAFKSAQEWLKVAKEQPGNEAMPWFKLLLSAGSAGPMGALAPAAMAMIDTLQSFIGGTSRASAYEPLAFRGQNQFWVEGSIESRSKVISINLAMKEADMGTHGGVRAHRPVQAIPWGIFNLESIPAVTGVGKSIHFEKPPVLQVNPDCGLELVSASYHLNIYTPTWSHDFATKRKVITRFDAARRQISDKVALDIGSGMIKDLLVELKFRTKAKTSEADTDITVLKTVPVRWVRTMPGTYAIQNVFKGDTYLFPRFHPTEPAGFEGGTPLVIQHPEPEEKKQ